MSADLVPPALGLPSVPASVSFVRALPLPEQNAGVTFSLSLTLAEHMGQSRHSHGDVTMKM